MSRIFFEDFEAGNFNQWSSASTGQEITTEAAHSGINSARTPTAAGDTFGKLVKFYTLTDEMWFVYWVYISNGVSPPYASSGYHMQRIALSPDGQFDGPAVESALKSLDLNYFPGTSGGTQKNWQIGLDIDDPSLKGKWTRWKYHVKLNTVGQSDGVLELWIDGTKRINEQAHSFRTSSTHKLQQWWAISNRGGGFGWPATAWWAVDDIGIWTTDPDLEIPDIFRSHHGAVSRAGSFRRERP